MMYFIKKYTPEIVFAFLFNIFGMISGFFMQDALISWYPTLIKSHWNPPNWVFGPVWTILYIFLGIVFAKLWNQKTEKQTLYKIFIVQMILNYIWTPLFFGMRRIDLGLYSLVIMWIFTFIFLIQARNEKTIFYLTLPYFAWISFAGFLNYQMLILN